MSAFCCVTIPSRIIQEGCAVVLLVHIYAWIIRRHIPRPGVLRCFYLGIVDNLVKRQPKPPQSTRFPLPVRPAQSTAGSYSVPMSHILLLSDGRHAATHSMRRHNLSPLNYIVFQNLKLCTVRNTYSSSEVAKVYIGILSFYTKLHDYLLQSNMMILYYKYNIATNFGF